MKAKVSKSTNEKQISPEVDPNLLLNQALTKALDDFDQESAYRSTQKLFPKLNARAIRVRSQDILFNRVLKILKLKKRDLQQFTAALSRIISEEFLLKGCGFVEHSTLEGLVGSAKLDLDDCNQAVLQARLLITARQANKKALAKATRAHARARAKLNRLQTRLENSNKRFERRWQRKLQREAALRRANPLLSVFLDWKRRRLNSIYCSLDSLAGYPLDESIRSRAKK